MEINVVKTYYEIKDDIFQHPLEYLTMLLAVIGSYYSSEPDSFSRGLGFAVWILSNGYMLIGFIRAKNRPYVVLFLFYEAMNIKGVLNNWF